MLLWLVGITKGETCPAGLGRGKHALRRLVRSAINALLVKRGWGVTLVGINEAIRRVVNWQVGISELGFGNFT